MTTTSPNQSTQAQHGNTQNLINKRESSNGRKLFLKYYFIIWKRKHLYSRSSTVQKPPLFNVHVFLFHESSFPGEHEHLPNFVTSAILCHSKGADDVLGGPGPSFSKRLSRRTRWFGRTQDLNRGFSFWIVRRSPDWHQGSKTWRRKNQQRRGGGQ